MKSETFLRNVMKREIVMKSESGFFLRNAIKVKVENYHNIIPETFLFIARKVIKSKKLLVEMKSESEIFLIALKSESESEILLVMRDKKLNHL